MNKRLIKEINKLIFEQNSKQLLDNDYLVAFDEQNINRIYTIIKGPYESVYRHKFIKLNFDIPSNYPYSPPKVTFLNYDGVRIHPNMYKDGKCCSTILNTWPSDNEKWTSSMGIETILLTFLSFLDNNPYIFEPGGRDDDSYTKYVLYQSWNTCLIKYLDDIQPIIFKEFINLYLLTNIETIFRDLREFNILYPLGQYYTSCFEIDRYTINYNSIIKNLEYKLQYIDYCHIDNYDYLEFKNFINIDYKCQICFDTETLRYSNYIKLSCNHNYHILCLKNHIKCNGSICSLCRNYITNFDLNKISKNTILNPDTNRQVKIGGKIYLKLLDEKKI